MTRDVNLLSIQKLQPEYARAVEFLDKNLSKSIRFSKIDSCTLLDGTFKVFEKRFPIKQIPSGKTWRWNQTNARKEVAMPHRNMTVKILKLIPRKRNTVPCTDDEEVEIPSLKIWQYEVTNPDSGPIFALWCEKGLQNNDILQTNSTADLDPESLDLGAIWDELSFLSSFMPESVAKSFWPSNY